MNVGVHPQLGLGHKPLATDVAGVLAAHVMALDVVLQGVLGLEHPAAAGTVEGRLAVLVVHVCLCTKHYRYKFNFIILVKQVHFFRKCCEKNSFLKNMNDLSTMQINGRLVDRSREKTKR